MKILKTSNYDSETYQEQFVTGIPVIGNNPSDMRCADQICHWLNALYPDGPDYWKIVDDDYVLKDGDPNA